MKGCGAVLAGMVFQAVFVYYGWRWGVEHAGEIVAKNPAAMKLFQVGFVSALGAMIAANVVSWLVESFLRARSGRRD